MRKIISVILAVIMIMSVCAFMVSCSGKEYEIAMIVDIGKIDDSSFNGVVYDGIKDYAEANGKTCNYYEPENGTDAKDEDRIAAINKAVDSGAKIVVCPGQCLANAVRSTAKENPNVKFVMIDTEMVTDSVDKDGKDNGKALENVTSVSFKEEESGYMAGYAVVKEGKTKIGMTLGGGGITASCNRYGYGFAQGVKDAANETSTKVELKVSYKYGNTFQASDELKDQIKDWYSNGTEVVFSCGGLMLDSVKKASDEVKKGEIVGVDVDQSSEGGNVITSAMKGLKKATNIVLDIIYRGQFEEELSGKRTVLGISDNATGLPTETWKLSHFTKEEYNELVEKIKNNDITVKNDIVSDCADGTFWTDNFAGENVSIIFE